MDWPSPEHANALSSQQREHAESVDDLCDADANAMRAQVAGVTATLASQLGEITAEMDRLRASLGSTTDIGDIQAELDALQSELTARGATSSGNRRRRPQSAPTRNGGLDDVDDCAEKEPPRVGRFVSVALFVLMLGGPLWPLTAQAIASFWSMAVAQQTPWYDQVVTDSPVPRTR